MLFPYILSVIVAVLKIQVSFSVVSFEASSNYVKKGSPFTLTCHASPLTGIVQFLKNGSIVGSCSAPLVGVRPGTCIPVDIVQVLASENTTWTILSASFSANNGTWECVHGTETSKTFVMITELAKDITINDASLPAEPTLNTEYNASVDCSYPTPNIKWTLQECTGTSNNNIDVNVNPRVIEDPSSCTYPAQKYFSAIKVSDMATPGKDPKCYMPWATLYYSFDSSASVPKKSNVSFSLPGLTTTTAHSTSSTLDTTSVAYTTTTIISDNKYWNYVGIGAGALLPLLLIICLCCIYRKRKGLQNVHINKESEKQNSLDHNIIPFHNDATQTVELPSVTVQ